MWHPAGLGGGCGETLNPKPRVQGSGFGVEGLSGVMKEGATCNRLLLA